MGRGRGITLKGEAARAFITGAMGKGLNEKPLTEDDKRLVVATKISMFMRNGTKADAAQALEILKIVETHGLEKSYDIARVL